MRLLMLGPPGSGKGTQGRRLAQRYGVAHLSTGEMLREQIAAGTDLGRRVAGLVAAGDLVPDEVVEGLMHDRVIEASRQGGYVLDGFPRTLHQAVAAYDIAVEAGATAHAVVHLAVPEPVVLGRLLGRDESRADDDAATIRHRLAVYLERTTPLIDYYAGRGVLVTVDAAGPPDEVFAAVVAAVERAAAG